MTQVQAQSLSKMLNYPMLKTRVFLKNVMEFAGLQDKTHDFLTSVNFQLHENYRLKTIQRCGLILVSSCQRCAVGTRLLRKSLKGLCRAELSFFGWRNDSEIRLSEPTLFCSVMLSCAGKQDKGLKFLTSVNFFIYEKVTELKPSSFADYFSHILPTLRRWITFSSAKSLTGLGGSIAIEGSTHNALPTPYPQHVGDKVMDNLLKTLGGFPTGRSIQIHTMTTTAIGSFFRIVESNKQTSLLSFYLIRLESLWHSCPHKKKTPVLAHGQDKRFRNTFDSGFFFFA